MSKDPLQEQRQYLAKLLEAIQRCAYFLYQSDRKLSWPLEGTYLTDHKKDVDLFETLAAINERFAKLQDSLAAAMKHSALLMSEQSDSFLKVLALFEKNGVVSSVEDWQRSRTARNLAAHDYETEYEEIAEHFNILHQMTDMLYGTAQRLLVLCEDTLGVRPTTDDFEQDFRKIADRR